MGIFDFLEDDDKARKEHYASLTVTTNNIPKAYLSASKKMGLEPKELDFKLQKVETFIKVAADAEFEPLSSEHATILKSKELLLNPELHFKQTYRVIFEKRIPHKYFLKAQLEVDKPHSMAKAKILQSSHFPPAADLKKWLVYEVNKFKIKHHILLGIFDWHMKQDIETLAAYIAKHGKLEKDVEITLSRWPVPATLTQDDELIHHYKKKINQSQKNVNHAERDFSNFIKTGTLVLEYVKPKEGVTGRDFSGHLIEAREPETAHEITFVIDNQTIETKEEEHSVKYYAKKDGYVIIESDMLLISDEIQMDSIDLRSTGHVTSDTDKEVTINIKGDATQDKIGPNMKVEVSNLSMGGSVAEGAEIRGKDIKIGGQTHLTSKIYTEKAQIKVHKGYLEAKEAKITSIESGVIYADTIHAEMAIGAELHGKNIHIKELKHHCVIEYSESLTIDKVSGEENKFILTAFAEKEEGAQLEALLDQLQESKEKVTKDERRLEKLVDQINKNKKNLELLEENIKEIRSKDQEPNKTIMTRYNDLVQERDEGETLKQTIADLNETIKILSDKLSDRQQTLFDARLTVNSRWFGYNEVFFNMLVPKKVLKYVPKEMYGPEEIFIGLDDDNEYDVKRRAISPTKKSEAKTAEPPKEQDTPAPKEEEKKETEQKPEEETAAAEAAATAAPDTPPVQSEQPGAENSEEKAQTSEAETKTPPEDEQKEELLQAESKAPEEAPQASDDTEQSSS